MTLPAPTFPGSEDPTNNPSRILIGKFNFTALAPILGIHPVYAIDPFSVGDQLLTGPNPPTDPADGFHGEIPLDQYLSQYAAPPVIPTLIITEPEPGTLALCGFAAGFLAWRGRHNLSPLPALRERGRG